MLKISLVATVLFLATTLHAHPDGAKPYWYPATYIFGFVEGCWETIEQSMAPMTEDMWPAQIKSVCGCVIDALRHSMSFNEIQDTFNDPEPQLIVNATLPICVEEQGE